MISNFTDTVLMGLDSIDADYVTNPFDFDKCWSTASRTSKSTASTKKYLEIVRYISGLHQSKQLSHLKTADIYSTTSMVASTGNTPKKNLVHNLYATSLQMRYILIYLEEPISSGYSAHLGLTWRNLSGWPAQPG
jgi:hypothetical protein